MSGIWINYEGHRVFVPNGEDETALRAKLDKAKAAGLLPDVIDGHNAKAPTPAVSPHLHDSGLKRIAVTGGIERNLLLGDVFLAAFKARHWSDLKNRYQRDDSGSVVLHLLDNDLAQGGDLRQAVEAVETYAKQLQRGQADFAYTDFQFFSILFAELFFRNQNEVLARVRARAMNYPMLRLYETAPPPDNAGQTSWIVSQLERLGDKVRNKDGQHTGGFAKKLAAWHADVIDGASVAECLNRHFDLVSVSEYLSRLNRLAFYMATGSGKTHLLHINLLQAQAHLPASLGLSPGMRTNFYLVAPTGDLAKQHRRELLRFFPGKIVRFTEEGDEKTVTESTVRMLQSRADIYVLTTHQLAAVMKRDSGGFFGQSNPFGEGNVVFADEGHKGADRDSGWRDDRNRLTGDKGFCFEYSATFSQSIKEKTPLIQEYAKAIIFDYPYRLFYRDGYGKRPEFFPKENAQAIAKSIVSGKLDAAATFNLSANERWILFVQQMARFHEQWKEHRDQSGNPIYRNHRFSPPLMLMIGQRVDDEEGASHVRAVIELLARFMANKGGETVSALHTAGSSNPKTAFKDLFREAFHSDKPATLDVRQLSDQELGLRASGGGRYFGVVYVGAVGSLGWPCEKDHLNDTLMTDFFVKGDHPDINIIVAARKLDVGWNTHRISSLGLVELGKAKGSLVVQLFGRGVRLAGTPEARLRRSERFPVSERFDVFGYRADYLKIFIEEAEAAEIVEEQTLAINIMIKKGEPKGRLALMPRGDFSASNHLVRLSADEEFKKVVRRQHRSPDATEVVLDPRPFVDARDMYRRLQEGILEQNVTADFESFTSCVDAGLSELTVPKSARLDSPGLIQRMATDKMGSLLTAYYRHHAQQHEFEHAELRQIDAKTSRNLNFGGYRVSGPAETISKLGKELVRAGAIIDSAFHFTGMDLAPMARFENEVIAVKSKPHLFDPLLVRLQNRDDIRISPDRLEASELRFVSAVHAYAHTNKQVDLALLRNQKEWGFLGFYPDFVLWHRSNGVEHIAFIDPKGLMLQNTEEVVKKLYFSIQLGHAQQRLLQKHTNVRLSSFILLNNPIKAYLKDKAQRALLVDAISELIQSRMLQLASVSPTGFTDEAIEQMLVALNAREGDDDIGGLLAAIANDNSDTRTAVLTGHLRASLPKKIQAELEDFYQQAFEAKQNGTFTDFLDQRKLSTTISDPAVALVAHLLLQYCKNENGYERLLNELHTGEWKKICKETSVFSGEITLDLMLEGLSMIVPAATIASKIARCLARRHTTKKKK